MIGAGNGTRTRDSQLGKLVLYQLSYARSLRSKTIEGQGLSSRLIGIIRAVNAASSDDRLVNFELISKEA